MQLFFQYNWEVREEWFAWCETISEEELHRRRTGGMGTILHTLFHIVDIEHAWIKGLQGEPEFHFNKEDFPSLNDVKKLSEDCKVEILDYINRWTAAEEDKTLAEFTHAEVIRHVIAHEIHHIGQLSVWSREVGMPPVSANLIGRNLRQ
ncbi:DinB family protein [Alteribacillus sp. HJP-4]|uniref:DinB family protein n=1 Tax=Alteribacillus sp. HJP-4 TaxID=2775394 RepID=UPI0035CCD7AD